MPAKRITVCISPTLRKRLQARANLQGCSQAEVVRAALENYLGSISSRRSAYDLAQAAGLIGRLHDAPTDLSTNRRHLKQFGAGR